MDETVRRARNWIVEHCSPVAVIFFGSRARGNPRPDTDYDFLIIIPDGQMDTSLYNRYSSELSR
jgi:predicted nucleotidyltransferase